MNEQNSPIFSIEKYIFLKLSFSQLTNKPLNVKGLQTYIDIFT